MTPPDASAGSFAEESARLMSAFQEWAAKGRAAAEDIAGEGDSAPGHHSQGPECGICPICQGMALLRGAKPEVVSHLSDALTSLAAAVSAFLPSDAGPAERRTTEKVQHIDVSGDDTAGTAG